MADEVQLQLVVPGRAADVMAEWRANPPDVLAGFELEDEAYNSLVYVERYYDWPQKLLFWVTFGVALLLKELMKSTFRLTLRFDDEDAARTKVTILGTAHPDTRRDLTAFAEAHGGSVGLRVGV